MKYTIFVWFIILCSASYSVLKVGLKGIIHQSEMWIYSDLWSALYVLISEGVQSGTIFFIKLDQIGKYIFMK